MLIELPRSNWFYAGVKKAASWGPASWFLARTLHHCDKVFMRLSDGRTSLTTLLTGLPVITVSTIGAKSRKHRAVPLLGIPTGERLILIASNWGQSFHPSWYFNLKANPKATVTYRGRTAVYSAIVTEGAERAECWSRAVSLYPGYQAYKRRAGDRQIPVIVLLPTVDRAS